MIHFPVFEAIEKFFRSIWEQEVLFAVWFGVCVLLVSIGVIAEVWVIVGAGLFVWLAEAIVFIVSEKRRNKENHDNRSG